MKTGLLSRKYQKIYILNDYVGFCAFYINNDMVCTRSSSGKPIFHMPCVDFATTAEAAERPRISFIMPGRNVSFWSHFAKLIFIVFLFRSLESLLCIHLLRLLLNLKWEMALYCYDINHHKSCLGLLFMSSILEGISGLRHGSCCNSPNYVLHSGK